MWPALVFFPIPSSILAGYADAVLGAIDVCDQPELLLRTLSTFLESNGSWEPAAKVLQVHRHTMRNRITRIEQITGKRPGHRPGPLRTLARPAYASRDLAAARSTPTTPLQRPERRPPGQACPDLTGTHPPAHTVPIRQGYIWC